MKIFISYSTKNQDVANRILGHLEEAGLPCFFAPRDIRTGCVYAEEIIDGINDCDALVLILSQASNTSSHVLREIERAVSLGKRIVTYRIEEVTLTKAMEYFLLATQWLDVDAFGNDQGLVQALANVLGVQVKTNQIPVQPEPVQPVVPVQPVAQVQSEAPAKKSKKPWVIALVAILVVCLLGTSIYFIVNNNDKPSVSDEDDDDDEDNGNNEVAKNPDKLMSEEDVPEEYLDNYNIGDEITFGTYNGAAISWRIVDIDYNGNATLIASNVLTFKSFDAAESGQALETKNGVSVSAGLEFSPADMIECYGNAKWENSNLRAWLNSDAEMVSYTDVAPVKSALADGKNAYNAEPGFLSEFTNYELDSMVEQSHTPIFYDIPESAKWIIGADTKEWMLYPDTEIEEDYQYIRDRVYLPSEEDLESLKYADIPFYVEPTKEAKRENNSSIYSDTTQRSGNKYSYYWLCDARENTVHEVRIVTDGTNAQATDYARALCDGIGVRPMICINLKRKYILDNSN